MRNSAVESSDKAASTKVQLPTQFLSVFFPEDAIYNRSPVAGNEESSYWREPCGYLAGMY